MNDFIRGCQPDTGFCCRPLVRPHDWCCFFEVKAGIRRRDGRGRLFVGAVQHAVAAMAKHLARIRAPIDISLYESRPPLLDGVVVHVIVKCDPSDWKSTA
jgi:hypothetical protein